MRAIKRIIVHCSYTPPSMDIGADEIRTWHVRDNGWRDIGYHFVIRRNGLVETGRPESEVGAHAKGHNHDSLGICLVGGKAQGKDEADANFTCSQYIALRSTALYLQARYGPLSILGHRDVAPDRACPGFDVSSFFSGFAELSLPESPAVP